MKSSGLFYLLLLIFLSGCVNRDYESLPAVTDGHQVTMVVEIPAGTSVKIEYNRQRRAFLPDSVNGKVRVIDFLPYPVNYGFIPSTCQRAEDGGDGDPLDVMLIGETLPVGTIVKVLPVGVLRLKDRGETDDKILVIPADPMRRVIEADDFASLSVNYPALINILTEWFVSYKGPGLVESSGWGDESEAWQEIVRCSTRSEE